MIVDFHAHVFPDRIAARAVSALEERGGVRACSDATVSGLLRSMDRAGVGMAVVLPVSTKKENVSSINRWAAGLRGDRLEPFGTLFPGMHDVRDEAARLMEAGIRGVKIHSDYQGVDADNPLMYPLYEACREYGIVALLHAGVDLALSPPVRATPEMIAAVLERFPGLTMIAAHMGGHRMWDDVKSFLAGREVYFDTAFCPGKMPEETFRSLLRPHGAGRVLFATDYPWLGHEEALTAMNRWDFSAEERRLILGENALRLLQKHGDE